LGNGFDGITITAGFEGDPSDNLIGGTDGGAGNVIAFNGRRGVNLSGGLQNGVLSNLIYSNGVLGIDLGNNGVTPNDVGDLDAGPNNLQNFPVLTSAATDGSRTTVSEASTARRTQVFSSNSSPPRPPILLGWPGPDVLGTRQVITDAAGNATFTFNFAVAVPLGQFISATATDPLNNTSEFSRLLQIPNGTVGENLPPNADAGGPYAINEGDGLTLNASLSADPDGDPLTYSWDLNGDGTFGDATGVKPKLTWAQLVALGIVNGPSSFTVKVRVDDGQGHVVISRSTTLTVLNVAPIADAGPDRNVTEGDSVTLTGTFTDPGTADTHTLHWHVDADNGQTIADGSGSTFSFVPLDNGTYVVTFAVTDSDGATGAAVVNVDVKNANPVATMLGLPAQGTVGVPINLTSSVTDVLARRHRRRI